MKTDLKRIPLGTVGKYCRIIENETEYDAARKMLKSGDCEDEIYAVEDADIPENEGISIKRISVAHARSIRNPYLPIWVSDERTLSLAIEGRYNEITPLSAEIFPSLRCCFHCAQCAYREAKDEAGIWSRENKKAHGELMMSLEDMKNAVNSLKAAGVKEVVFTGGGEPLMNYEVTAAGIEQACESGIKTGLFTNGYLLTADKAERLLSAQPDFIRISVYGFDKKSFSEYTSAREDCYRAVIENLKNLIAIRNKKGVNTRILLSVLMQPLMIPDVKRWEEFTVMFTEEELKSIGGVRMTPAINYHEREKQHDIDYFNSFISYMDAYSEAHEYPKIMIFRHRLEEMYGKKSYSGCEGSRLFAELGPEGKAYYCCEKACDDRNIIGNYIEQSLCSMCKDSSILRETFDNTDCPYVCKPHEFNRFLNDVKRLVSEGKADEVIAWAEELKRINGSERVS